MLRGHAEVRAGGWGGSTDVGAKRDGGLVKGGCGEEAPGGGGRGWLTARREAGVLAGAETVHYDRDRAWHG